MNYYRLRRCAFACAALVVLFAGVGCGSSSTTSSTTAPPLSVALTLVPTSGTLDAVNPDSLLYEIIPASAGIVDPASVKVSISPSVLFTEVNGFSGGTFANSIDIIPSGFLPQATAFSITTNFLVVQNNTVYSVTAYNFFTTAAVSAAFPASAGDSYLLNINTLIQPPGLMSLIPGTLPEIAASILTATVSSNPSAAGADGSFLLYGGQAFSSSSPTDIDPSAFSLPVIASYQENEFIASGAAVVSVSGFTITFQSLSLRGTLNTDGTISDGIFYGLIHCADAACSNISDSTIALGLSSFADTNNNVVVLGSVSGIANTVTSGNWITAGDTVQTNLTDGVGVTTSALVDITTSSSPLTDTATLPFLILTQTDANNMLSLSAQGQGAVSITTTAPQVSIDYPLVEPGLSMTPFTTSAGQTYTAYFMFGLTNVTADTFTP